MMVLFVIKMHCRVQISLMRNYMGSVAASTGWFSREYPLVWDTIGDTACSCCAVQQHWTVDTRIPLGLGHYKRHRMLLLCCTATPDGLHKNYPLLFAVLHCFASLL